MAFQKGNKPPRPLVDRMDNGRLLPHQKAILAVNSGRERTLLRNRLGKSPSNWEEIRPRLEEYFQYRLPDVYQAMYKMALRGSTAAARLLMERFDHRWRDRGKEPEDQEVAKRLVELIKRVQEGNTSLSSSTCSDDDPIFPNP